MRGLRGKSKRFACGKRNLIHSYTGGTPVPQRGFAAGKMTWATIEPGTIESMSIEPGPMGQIKAPAGHRRDSESQYAVPSRGQS